MIHKTIEYRRMQRERHIQRKENILSAHRSDNPPRMIGGKAVTGKDLNTLGSHLSYGNCDPYYRIHSRGYLAKGKIHCSCPRCAFHSTTIQDKRRLASMVFDLEDSDLHLGTERAKIHKEITGRWYPNSSAVDYGTLKKASDYNAFLLEEFYIVWRSVRHVQDPTDQRKVLQNWLDDRKITYADLACKMRECTEKKSWISLKGWQAFAEGVQTLALL